MDAIQTLAGECVVEEHGDRDTIHRGRVVVLVKPDGTVLVHDIDGYQPVAWVTRAQSVSVERGTGRRGRDPDPGRRSDPDDAAPDVSRRTGGDAPFVVSADTDAYSLRVVAERSYGEARYPASAAGPPAGPCPECGGSLVRVGDALDCTACGFRARLPAGSTLLGERCDCGSPRIRVERGAAFDVCADRDCDPLDERVRERFDGAWACPDCGAPLRILRRGGLIAGCERYPACETGFAIPDGVVAGECPCGLPLFDTGSGRRCLDGRCDRTDP